MIGLLMCQSVIYTLAMQTRHYILQDERLCDSTECGVQMHYVTLDDEIKVYGGWVKVHPSSHTHGSCGRDLACELQLVPDSGSLKKQEFHLIFLQFQLDDSNDEFMLKLDQASSTSFKDVSQIATITRDSERPHDYMSGVGKFVRFRLTHGNRTDDFGFTISVTRTGATFDPSKSDDNPMALSPPVTIFISVIGIIILFFIVYMIIKTIKLRSNFLSSRRNSGQPLNNIALTERNPSHPRRAEANSYTQPPSADRPSIVRHASDEDESYVLTDFPYVNTPMVIVGNSDSPPDSTEVADSTEVPAKPPPTYEDVMQFSDE
ncbi:uncharacterized protein LOC130046356 [Ostrea edulis]|uniref:uncharacterized protein LOC130046356 n=1 Tax=Ostrea edulis TaxID=37623 RepID=UPI0024AF3C46|nr:uncharacterized protein LOC130046356 [Ostrea edulis]